MSGIVAEWLAKSAADLRSAKREIDAEPPNYDLVCFLAQQCVEKCVKAYLQSQSQTFPRTHDLIVLLELALPIQPLWEAWRSSFYQIKEYAVEFRYPGESATSAEAHLVLEIAQRFFNEAQTIIPVS